MKSGEVDLLRQLAAEAAREESASDEERLLEQLTLARLDEPARMNLEQEARRDPRLARAVARHRPLSPASRRRIADHLVALTVATGSPRPLVVPPRRRARVGIAVTGMLAMAAAVLLWARPWSGGGDGRAAMGLALPAYAMTASGGDSVLRGTPAAPSGNPRLLLAPQAPVDIVVRPAATVKGRIDARVFLQQDARWEPAAVTPEVAPTGTIRLRGDAGTILGQRRGDWLLVVLVGRPAALAGEGTVEQLARGPASSGAGWQRLSLPVTVAGDR